MAVKWKWTETTGSSTNLEPRVNALEISQEQQNTFIETNANSITTLQTDLGDLGNQVVDLNNAAVKTSGNQTIAGTKIFSNETKHNGGINAVASSLSNGYVSTRRLELGYGSGTGYITPEDGSNKTLKFGGYSGKGRFNLDLENTSKLLNIPTPINNGDAVNKSYVDSKVAGPSLLGTLTLNNQNPNNKSLTITEFNINYPLHFEVSFNKIGTSSPHNQIYFCATIFPPTLNGFFKLLDERYIDVYHGGSVSGNIVLFVTLNSNTQLTFLTLDTQTNYQYIKIYGTPNS